MSSHSKGPISASKSESSPQESKPSSVSNATNGSTSNKDLKNNHNNAIGFCLLLIGLGVGVGFLCFYVLFKESCAKVLMGRELSHNSTSTNLQLKYNRALDDVKQCEQDGRTKAELQEQLLQRQKQLQDQTQLSDKHQDLLNRHEGTLQRISELQQSSEVTQLELQAARDEVKNLHAIVEDTSKKRRLHQKERDEIEAELKKQIDRTRYFQLELGSESARLNTDLNQCTDDFQRSQGKLGELKNLVQQQNLASVMAMYVL